MSRWGKTEELSQQTEETKETRQSDAMGALDQTLAQRKEISGNTGKMQVRSADFLKIVFYQC